MTDGDLLLLLLVLTLAPVIWSLFKHSDVHKAQKCLLDAGKVQDVVYKEGDLVEVFNDGKWVKAEVVSITDFDTVKCKIVGGGGEIDAIDASDGAVLQPREKWYDCLKYGVQCKTRRQKLEKDQKLRDARKTLRKKTSVTCR